MITYGTKSGLGINDFKAGVDMDINNFEKPAGVVYEYNQNEFKQGSSYCTAYACFTNYSYYTGHILDIDKRKEFINRCLDKKLITDGVGGYQYKVVNEFHNWINDPRLYFFNVKMSSPNRTTLQNLGFMIMSGFTGSSEFVKDRQDDCIVEGLYGNGEWGHAINESKNGLTTDNYSGRKCNQYRIEKYEEFLNAKGHFQYGFVFTYLKEGNMNDIKLGNINDQNLLNLYFCNKATYNNVEDEELRDLLAKTNNLLREKYNNIIKE